MTHTSFEDTVPTQDLFLLQLSIRFQIPLPTMYILCSLGINRPWMTREPLQIPQLAIELY
jgi:hypothetical protein